MKQQPLLVGWREWAKLPELNIPLVKVKIDTGAKTSALHAYDINIIKEAGKEFVEFVIHPLQKTIKYVVSLALKLWVCEPSEAQTDTKKTG